jgi:cytoskeletal protein CcmA (bactofilin family)
VTFASTNDGWGRPLKRGLLDETLIVGRANLYTARSDDSFEPRRGSFLGSDGTVGAMEVTPMWKREETPRPPSSPANVVTEPLTVTGGIGDTRGGEQRPMKQESVSIGKSIVIKGEVSGSEDLTIEGQVEGKIELRDNILSVGQSGRVQAHIVAKAIVVHGEVTGNLTAAEKVEIRENGAVEGDIVAPRVAIADGAKFRGSIDMRRDEPSSATDRAAKGRKAESMTPISANGEGVSV